MNPIPLRSTSSALLCVLASLCLVGCGRDSVHKAVSRRDHNALKNVLDRDAGIAEIDTIDANGMTPLHVALREQDAEAVKLLLEHGARYDIPDREGLTAIETSLLSALSGREHCYASPDSQYAIVVKQVEGRKLIRPTLTMTSSKDGRNEQSRIWGPEAELRWDGAERVLKLTFPSGEMELSNVRVSFADPNVFTLPHTFCSKRTPRR